MEQDYETHKTNIRKERCLKNGYIQSFQSLKKLDNMKFEIYWFFDNCNLYFFTELNEILLVMHFEV